jgi:hypothetical protein
VTLKECKFRINKLQNEIDYITSTNENLDKLEELTTLVNSLKSWLEREIDNIKTNGSKLDKIIYYREEDGNKYTWESNKQHSTLFYKTN